MGRGPVEEKICGVASCDRTLYARKLCRRHYLQWQRSGGTKTPQDIIDSPFDRLSAPEPKCTEPGCDRTRIDSMYCNLHRQAHNSVNKEGDVKKQKKICSVDGCQNESRTRGMCNKHYQAWYRDHSNEEGRLVVPHVR